MESHGVAVVDVVHPTYLHILVLGSQPSKFNFSPVTVVLLNHQRMATALLYRQVRPSSTEAKRIVSQ